MTAGDIEILQFSNRSREDRLLLRQFVDFHWKLYEGESRYIPLLDYEYLGNRALGMVGWFEPRHTFFTHGEMTFFLARRGGKTVGRVCAYVNHNHNRHWKDKVGFFGFFESVEDQEVSGGLLDAAARWLKSQGMTAMRGPTNLPVNEATPGTMVEGFDTTPVIYYHFNYPYYRKLFEDYGMETVKKVVSYDVPVGTPVGERLTRVTKKASKRYGITVETFSRKRFHELKTHMLRIYNECWKDNWGFVPFEEEEFYSNLDDMKLVWDPKLFLFAYVKGEPAGFVGSVPNILERMRPVPGLRRAELLRAGKMLLTKGTIRSGRFGYLGVLSRYRKLGLEAVLITRTKQYLQARGYRTFDIGWVLEDNKLTRSVSEFMGGTLSRVYAVFEAPLS